MQSVELGFECNNACSFCAQGRLRTVSTPPETEGLIATMSSLAAGEIIAFVGGEPTLRDDLCELVRSARARTENVLLQTNGRRLGSAGYAQALAAAGVTALDVSLHGSSEAMHDYHTGVPGSFRQTIAGLRRARAARLPFGITTVVTRSNYRHLADIVRIAHTLGARAVQFAPLLDAGSATPNASRLIVRPALSGPHVQHALEALSRLGLDWLAGERASRAEVRDWFAGTGRIEDVAPASGPIPVASLRDADRKAELQQAGVG